MLLNINKKIVKCVNYQAINIFKEGFLNLIDFS